VVATERTNYYRSRRELAARAQLQAVFEQAPVARGRVYRAHCVVEVCSPALQAIWGRSRGPEYTGPYSKVLPIRDQG
jgi:hypothetical protein